MKTAKTKKDLKYQFSSDELRELGSQLADATIELRQIEEDKKRVTSDFTAKITTKDLDISQLSTRLQSGYEFRFMECTVRFHEPKEGQATVARDDTGETVEVRDMTPAEMQEQLNLEVEA